MKEKSKNIYTRVPESLSKKLNKLAAKEYRSVSSIIRQAIKELLASRKWY